jgi:ribonuclease E
MKKEMLINVMQPEECRIAILEDGVLEELYVERTSQESYVGNIYKGRIVNIEPSIQAAFVDFGIGRNGFLHVSDVEPAYYRHLEPRRERHGNGPRRGTGRDRDRDRDRDRGRDGDRGRRRRPPRDDEMAQRNEPPHTVEEDLDELDRQLGPPQRPIVDAAEDIALVQPDPIERGRPTDDDDKADESPSTPPPQRPKFMDSAERRTEKDKHRTDSPDDDLFFPRSEGGKPEAAEPTSSSLSRAAEPDDAPAERPELPSRADHVVAEYEEDESDEGGSEPPREPDELPFAEGADDLDAHEETEGLEDELADFSEERHRPFDEDEDMPPPRRHRGRDGGRDGGREGGRRPGGRRRFPGRPGAGRPKPLIQDIFKRGQEVLVQVIKEGIGTKGPTLSTYISIAGRYLVLMPGLNRVGVSRKIADDDARRRLREIFHELQPPKGLGFIIRTAGMDRSKKELQGDLAYLARLWQVVVRRLRKLKSPAEIYQESDMITRTIRDTFTKDIETIWVDEPSAFEHAQEFLQIVMPGYASRIKLYADPEPIFYKHGIEEEIVRIQQRHVPLPTGGSIVIDQTEALVAIDVNSGNFRADNNAEETAYQMNLQAAKEIARQLRLRDLGGVIVNDFIDMREEKHRRGVEKALRDAVRRDRARTKILKISAFGLIEMTRQRIRPSLKRSIYQDCVNCHGTGQIKTTESMSIDVMRMIQLAAHRENIARVQIKVTETVANYLLNRKRKEIARLEEAGEIQVTVMGQPAAPPETLEFLCYDNNNNEIKFLTYEETKPRRR